MIIDAAAHAAMIEHLRQAAPHEGCGLLAGPRPDLCPYDTNGDGDCGRRHCPHCLAASREGRVCDRWVPLPNRSEFPRLRFEMDDAELLDAWNALDADGHRRPWIIVHSHVNAGPAPSPTDIVYAVDPTLLHLIVSIGGVAAYPRLWRIRPHLTDPRERTHGVPFDVVDLGKQKPTPTDLTRRVADA